jgi:hypothetical protein
MKDLIYTKTKLRDDSSGQLTDTGYWILDTGYWILDTG